MLGYVPKVEDCVIESRHLGLVLPEEIPELKNRLGKLSEILEKTLDIDGILKLAGKAPELSIPEFSDLIRKDSAFGYRSSEKVRIGVADDEAFCFFYADNLSLLEQMGAELVHFSPIHDTELPGDLDGLWRLSGAEWKSPGGKPGDVQLDTEGRGRWNALSGGMRRFYVSSSGNGRYGGKFPQSLRRDPGKIFPYTETDQIWIYYSYGKKGFRPW